MVWSGQRRGWPNFSMLGSRERLSVVFDGGLISVPEKVQEAVMTEARIVAWRGKIEDSKCELLHLQPLMQPWRSNS
ncbi:hypothetical protein L1987_17928 [Smallanthus sonchifolius]|uniref:Uncharacterized protein n=1 Tax=Smallanthus sonchifolius TaxID=185202 RepID=A0ACB9IYX8_9ASTR|nr:hypothetical protein L1987_17928 [Smallanthus sonchifolius]